MSTDITPAVEEPGTAAATKGAIYRVGMAFLGSSTVLAGATDLGFGDGIIERYLANRFGVLGPCPAEVVVSCAAFFYPPFLLEAWPRVCDMGPVERARDGVRAGAADHVAAAWAGVSPADASTLGDAAARIVDAAPLPGLPLFGAWRSTERPTEARAHAVYCMNLLREWRAAVHITVLAALGISALDAIVGNSGPDWAQFYQWPQPWQHADGYLEQLAVAETLTDQRCQDVIDAALSAPEQAEFIRLCTLVDGLGS